MYLTSLDNPIISKLPPSTQEELLKQGLECEDYQSALLFFEEALIIDPEHTNAWNNQERVLKELGRQEEALASYQQAFEGYKAKFEVISPAESPIEFIRVSSGLGRLASGLQTGS